jgi:hypothetical protein
MVGGLDALSSLQDQDSPHLLPTKPDPPELYEASSSVRAPQLLGVT